MEGPEVAKLKEESKWSIIQLLEKNEIMKLTGKWTEWGGRGVILSEITQTQKDRHGMYSLICGYSL